MRTALSAIGLGCGRAGASRRTAQGEAHTAHDCMVSIVMRMLDARALSDGLRCGPSRAEFHNRRVPPLVPAPREQWG